MEPAVAIEAEEPHGARLLGLAGTFIGAAGFAASLACVYSGMRNVMGTHGGFCASGGPYVIQEECSSTDVGLVFGGVLAMLAFWGIHAAFSARSGGSGIASGLLGWGALFAVLGWNFIELGIVNPPDDEIVWGWAISGIVFWLMAAGGLIPVVGMGLSRLRRGDEPERNLFREPLVRATATVEMPTSIVASSPPVEHVRDAKVWFAATLAGAIAGIALGLFLVDAVA